jgi:hypothetical protein
MRMSFSIAIPVASVTEFHHRPWNPPPPLIPPMAGPWNPPPDRPNPRAEPTILGPEWKPPPTDPTPR